MNIKKKILVSCALLFLLGSWAQENCNVICHNGSVLAGVNVNALQGHIDHGDKYITNDCDYVITGDEGCDSLSMPRFELNNDFELSIDYKLYDMAGKLIQEGRTHRTMRYAFPRNKAMILHVEGYEPIKVIRRSNG
jgi:hypothetical protein